jgi:hypothetical protein
MRHLAAGFQLATTSSVFIFSPPNFADSFLIYYIKEGGLFLTRQRTILIGSSNVKDKNAI